MILLHQLRKLADSFLRQPIIPQIQTATPLIILQKADQLEHSLIVHLIALQIDFTDALLRQVIFQRLSAKASKPDQLVPSRAVFGHDLADHPSGIYELVIGEI